MNKKNIVHNKYNNDAHKTILSENRFVILFKIGRYKYVLIIDIIFMSKLIWEVQNTPNLKHD
jgi:hypothetical protein